MAIKSGGQTEFIKFLLSFSNWKTMKKTLIIQFIEIFFIIRRALFEKKICLVLQSWRFFLHAGQNGKQNGQQPNFI